MNATWDELDGRGLSGRLWRKFALPSGGVFERTASGNPAFGFIDDFLKYGNTSLYDGKIILAGSGCSVAQISSEAGRPGIIRATIDGNGANDEAVMQAGAGLDVGPFKAAGSELAFEACIRVSAITAAKWSWFVGLATGGAAGAAITKKMFADTSGAVYATQNFIGFQHLAAEGAALDAMYQASGKTKVDGAVNTDLDTIHTLVANAWVKLGIRYNAHPKRLSWYVDGVEKAHILESDIDADEFPDAAFLQPTIGVKDKAGDAALTIDMDWWAVAQQL